MALDYGKMEFAVSFKPITAFPLDSRSYYESLAAAEAAAASAVEAGSDQGTVYFGQVITVVENGVAQMLQVQPDGTLSEVGGKIEIDEKQFTIDEETGKLNLYGFAEAVAGAQLVVEVVDGVKSLKWVKPDTTTVDGLATAVADLETALGVTNGKVSALETAVGKDGEEPTGLFADVAAVEGRLDTAEGDIEVLEGAIGDLEELVGAPKEGEAEATGLFAEVEGLETRLDDVDITLGDVNTALGQKANAADVYTKSEVYTVAEADNAIAVAVAGAAHLKRVKVDSVDAINVEAADAEQYIYMVPAVEGDATQGDLYDEYMVLEGKVERVGDWKVDLSGYALKTTVEDLGVEVNGIKEQLPDFAKSADVEEALAGKVNNATLEGYATTGALAGEVAKLATKTELGDLETIVNGKLDAEEGKGLVANEEIAKLLTIAEGAEVNFVKSINEEQLAISEAGKLSITEVDQALIGGLHIKSGADATLEAVLAEKAYVADVNAAISDINTALENKVEKNGTDRLITLEEASKLEALVIGEGGKVEISGKVNASNVQELYNSIVNIVTGIGEGTYDGVTKELLGIERGAEVNVIEAITLNGSAPLEVSDKIVNIPLAMGSMPGLVKSSEDENMIKVLTNGAMEVNKLNVNKLVQDEGDVLVLNGGNSAGEYPTE